MTERTSERSGGRERSEQSGASGQVSSAIKRANGRASDPILMSQFLVDPDHSGMVTHSGLNTVVTSSNGQEFMVGIPRFLVVKSRCFSIEP